MYNFNSKMRESASNHDQTMLNGRKSYNFHNMQKGSQLSQTDKRIEQIKKKYDTPNRRERISQLSAKKSQIFNKENQNYGTADFKTRSFITPNCQTEGDQNRLQNSKVLSNSKKNYYNHSSIASKNFNHERNRKQTESYESKLLNNKLYKNENQEEFFKRVKQMKQSLLADNSGKSNDMKQSFVQCRESRARSGIYDSNRNVEKDRIDNIDKINQKIKGILECLNENQKGKVSSKYDDLYKKNKFIDPQVHQKQANSRYENRTPIKNVLSGSIMGRSTFGNHRQQRSQILQKYQINRDPKQDQIKKGIQNQQDKWQKLSSKLEKYELQNKLRLQKALITNERPVVPQQKNLVQNNHRNNRSFYQPQVEQKKPTEIVRRDNRSVDFRDLRSRSFINSNTQVHSKEIRVSPKATRERDLSLGPKDTNLQHDYSMKSGKKLDDQIDRIQRKIAQFEEDKKRLNINFKPFHYSNTKSTSNLPMNNLRYEVSDKKISQFTKSLYKNDKIQKQQTRQDKKYQEDRGENQSTFRQKKQSFKNQSDQFQNEYRLQSKIQIKLEKSNPSSVKTSKFISQNSSRVSNDKDDEESYAVEHQTKQQIQNKSREKQFVYFFDQSMKKRTDDGIQERRKKLQSSSNVNPSNTDLKNLVSILCEQVRLDEDLRNAKIWYEYNENPNKQNQFKRLLPDKNVEQIREILKVRQSQNNPFFTTQGYESSFSRLAELYKVSENHWREKVYKRFDKRSLQNQGFTNKEFDLQKKGHINLGDLVRFLNLQSGTFYRNRDLALIFIRICRQFKSSTYTQVEFDWLSTTFCA